MAWRILDGSGRVVESHDTPRKAERAMMILSAHEVKNGRVAAYTITPPITIPSTVDELRLPDWALEALELRE